MRVVNYSLLRAGRILISLVAASMLVHATFAAPAPATADSWQQLRHAKWVAQGAKTPKHLVYVVIDANCPYCHELWTKLQPHYAQGLQVRYVLVGYLSSSSPGKAAAILEAPSPGEALARNELDWGTLPDDLGGGIQPKRHPGPGTLAALRANERLIRDIGVLGTPGLLYRDKDGRVHLIQSVPSDRDLDGILASASAG